MNTPSEALSAAEDRVEAAPLPAIGLAFGAGVLLSRLPVLGIAGLALRVALSLVKPALLALGAMKAWDLARNGCPGKPAPPSAPNPAP